MVVMMVVVVMMVRIVAVRPAGVVIVVLVVLALVPRQSEPRPRIGGGVGRIEAVGGEERGDRRRLPLHRRDCGSRIDAAEIRRDPRLRTLRRHVELGDADVVRERGLPHRLVMLPRGVGPIDGIDQGDDPRHR